MSAWVKQNNGDYLNPITGHWWKKEDDVWQLYEGYGQYRMIAVSSDDFVEIEKKLASSGNESRLRDQIAMQAMNGLLSNSGGVIQPNSFSGTGYVNCSHSSVAEWAYELADAMLKERDK